jgi:hypothetical protein
MAARQIFNPEEKRRVCERRDRTSKETGHRMKMPARNGFRLVAGSFVFPVEGKGQLKAEKILLGKLKNCQFDQLFVVKKGIYQYSLFNGWAATGRSSFST